jgi:hypothetical protein
MQVDMLSAVSFEIIEIKDSFDNTIMFSDFVRIVNSHNSIIKVARM